MRTILYNIITNEPISKIFENGYNIPIPETFVKEIEVVDTPMPQLESNQHASSHYEYLEGKWVMVWETFIIEVYPIVWHYQRNLRVQVPMSLVRENKEKIEFGAIDNQYLSQLLTYMLATDTIQRKIENDTLFAYFDTIFPEHEAILNSVNLTVEYKSL